MRVINMIVGILLIMAGCTNMDRPVDKSRLRPYDYRLFQGTEAWQLAKAAKLKDIKRVNEILANNPHLVNVTDSINGNTLLMLSIINQDHKLFRTLLDHGANVNYHNSLGGFSPLIEACFYKEYDISYAKELVEKGANVNDTSSDLPYAQISPLMAAVRHNNRDLMEFLISNGANMDYKDNFGTTVLGQALLARKYDMALLLLEKGADFISPIYNGLDSSGKLTVPTSILTSLRYATPEWGTSGYRKKREIIKFLKERGLDYDTVPIPDYIIQEAKERYPFIWKWYLRNY